MTRSGGFRLECMLQQDRLPTAVAVHSLFIGDVQVPLPQLGISALHTCLIIRESKVVHPWGWQKESNTPPTHGKLSTVLKKNTHTHTPLPYGRTYRKGYVLYTLALHLLDTLAMMEPSWVLTGPPHLSRGPSMADGKHSVCFCRSWCCLRLLYRAWDFVGLITLIFHSVIHPYQ